jgi:hypothetical protein
LSSTANRSLESASPIRSVSGDLATTANFADVVSGEPTSGESATTSAACGAKGSVPGVDSRDRSHVPRPEPPRKRRRTASFSGIEVVAPVPTSTRSARPW